MNHTETTLKDLRLPISVVVARAFKHEGWGNYVNFLQEQGLKLPAYCFYAGRGCDFQTGVHNGVVLILCGGQKRHDNKYLILEQRPDGSCVVKNWYQNDANETPTSPRDFNNEPVEHPATLHGFAAAQEALTSYLTPFISLSTFDKQQHAYYKDNANWL